MQSTTSLEKTLMLGKTEGRRNRGQQRMRWLDDTTESMHMRLSKLQEKKLPLRVDCIHRVEFGEVSGHRVLIKRGPGNRGPTECGTTHEATSGMSS